MKKLSILFAFLLLSVLTYAQTDGNKTLVKTLDPEGAAQIIFDFKHKSIDAKPWDNKGLRIQLEIHSNMPEAILAQLVKAGRYTLEGVKEGDIFYITAPNLGKNVTIGGKALEEEIILHVDMPGYLQLLGNKLSLTSDFVARSGTAKITSKMNLNIEFKFVCTNPEFATAATKEESKTTTSTPNKKVTKKAATASADKGAPASGGAPAMTAKELQSRFGEILIDGVVFEVE